MVVNGKFVEYDLSRFKNCTFKSAALCDLMGIPEFASAVEAYQGEITNDWLLSAMLDIKGEVTSTYSSPTSGSSEKHYAKRKLSVLNSKIKLVKHQPVYGQISSAT